MPETSNPPVFGARMRWAAATGAVVGGAAMVWLAGPAMAESHASPRYVLAHALSALPFLLVGMLATGRAVHLGPPEYRVFWRRWLAACATGVMAATAAVTSAVTGQEAFLLVDMALLLAGGPLWVSASVLMARAQAGRRSVSVDLLDALTALLVLGAPGVLVVAEPLVEADEPAFAVPFALMAVAAPVTVYLSMVNLFRIPRGARAAQGIGGAFGAVSGVNLTLQLARVLGGLTLPLRAFVGVHVLNMALLMAPPFWAHRRPTGTLALLPAHRQLRQVSLMPYVSAVALPLMGIYVFLGRRERPWAVWFLLVIVLAVVLLNAVRYTALTLETRRLSAGLSRMAEERRELLARMLRALEDDRHRTAAELHSQVVGSLAALGTLAQMAHVALPGDTAVTVSETVEQLQGDLTARAEHLRQLMLAIRPEALRQRPRPGAEPQATGSSPIPGPELQANDDLAAALLAYIAQLAQDGATPATRIEVDPELRLDWATTTIVYRIAQEAVLNAVRHAGAGQIVVTVAPQGGRVVLEVDDDGVGFDPAAVERGSGLAAMEMFTHLGRGELGLRSAPGMGTSVRAELGGCIGGDGGDGGDGSSPAAGRHLRAVTGRR